MNAVGLLVAVLPVLPFDDQVEVVQVFGDGGQILARFDYRGDDDELDREGGEVCEVEKQPRDDTFRRFHF